MSAEDWPSLDELFDENYSYPSFPWAATPCISNAGGLDSTGLVIVYISVFFISLLGNAVVIFVVSSMERRRTSTDVYLMNLALANLLFSLTLPFWAVYVHIQWVFGTVLCKLLSGLQEATFYSGIFLLACISIDRYLAIVKATQLANKKRHLVGSVCCMVWFAALLLSLPIMTQRESFQPHGHDIFVCYENLTAKSMDHWRIGLRIMRHMLGFFLPLTVMVVCYGCTVCTLCRVRNGQRHKAMRVILSVMAAFVVCWLPNNVTELVDTLMRGELLEDTCEARNRVDMALEVTQVLAFLHCAINPILYAFIGKKFRNQLLVSLFKKGIIGRQIMSTYRVGSQHSSGQSRHTSVTL